MYNYLMKAGGWAARRDTLLSSRVYHADLRPELQLTNGVASAEILALPTLMLPEIDGTAGQMARIVTITATRQYSSSHIQIDYADDPLIPPVPVKTIVNLAADLDIHTDGFALNHTHWTVRKADLFRVLLQHQATQGPAPTIFRLAHERDERLIGVMMPFDPGFSDVYETIKMAAQDAGCDCKRADDIWLHPQVMQTIVSLICKSDIVVVDCTNKNPNVFYEAGIAHTLGQDVILIAQHIDYVPFDLRHLHVLVYLNNSQGRNQLRVDLAARIAAIKAARP